MIRTMNKKLIILYGPTAVGKTDIALHLAEGIAGEIINADVGQLYTPCSIGTAKPLWKTLSVAHHLFDIIDNPEDITVVTYRKYLISCLQEIWQRKKIPILVGGSGFYILSILFPPQETGAKSYVAPAEDFDDSSLWDKLNNLDPTRAHQINKADMYRLRRALALWHSTGIKPSDHAPHYNPPAPTLFITLDRDTTDLHARINSRVDDMVVQGWIDETKKLKGTAWETFLMRKKLLGYDDIMRYLNDDPTIPSLCRLKEIIAQKTRSYAKRQRTFGRMMHRKIAAANQIASFCTLPIPLYVDASFDRNSLLNMVQSKLPLM